MTTDAAGRRVGAGVRRRRSDIERDRMLIRVNQGKGRKDRYPLLSARLRADLRTSWHLSRPTPWLWTGHDRTQPLSVAPAPKIYSRAKRAAGSRHGKGIQTRRHCFATHLLAAGGALHTIQLLLGHRTIDTTTRYLPITRRHLAKGHSPFDLLRVAAELPDGATE
jgi:site-specific recombinase XerD